MPKKMTQAEYAAERKRVDEYIENKKKARRAAPKKKAPPAKTYPTGIEMLSSIHPGFKNLYDSLITRKK